MYTDMSLSNHETNSIEQFSHGSNKKGVMYYYPKPDDDLVNLIDSPQKENQRNMMNHFFNQHANMIGSHIGKKSKESMYDTNQDSKNQDLDKTASFKVASTAKKYPMNSDQKPSNRRLSQMLSHLEDAQ